MYHYISYFKLDINFFFYLKHNFKFIFIRNQYNSMFCVDKIKYEHLAILSNQKVANLHPE